MTLARIIHIKVMPNTSSQRIVPTCCLLSYRGYWYVLFYWFIERAGNKVGDLFYWSGATLLSPSCTLRSFYYIMGSSQYVKVRFFDVSFACIDHYQKLKVKNKSESFIVILCFIRYNNNPFI